MAFGWPVSAQMRRFTWVLVITMAAILASNVHRAHRALELCITVMGTSPMAVIFIILTGLFLLIKAYHQHGWAGIRQHWGVYAEDGLYFTLAFWTCIFAYQFIFNAPVYLDISLTPQSGYSSTLLKAGQEITPDTMRDRKQYLLVLANKTHSVFDVVELRLQLPYPIDEKEILSSKDTGNVKFDKAGAVPRFEGGSTTLMRTLLTSVYELHIENMRPGGQVQLLFILNSWRDPRGKTIPPDEQARYRIPDVGPHITYMDGHFLADDIKEPYYAPFSLSEDGVVTLENQQAAPKELERKKDFQ